MLLLLLTFSIGIPWIYSLTDERPKMETRMGNLYVTSGVDKHISLLTQGDGRVFVNNLDVSDTLKNISLRNDKINQCSVDATTALEKVEKLEKTVFGSPGVVERLEILEKTKNSTFSIFTRGILSNLRRRLTILTRKVRVFDMILLINKCNSNPCSNGGTCIDTVKGYTCLCPNTWEGPNCYDDFDECTSFAGTELGCQNGATCVNTKGSYKCICPQGLYGIHCTMHSNSCNASREMCGHGTCIPKSPGYTCICDQGWEAESGSPACTVDINECANYHPPCSSNPPVKCINLPGTFYCGHCPLGYSGNGFYCNDVDECLDANGGCSVSPKVQCMNTPGSRMCGLCPPGYLGDGVICTYQGGTCGVNNGGCHPVAQCTSNSRISSTYVECRCPAGYSGGGFGPNGCIRDINQGACSSNPCVHGTCMNAKDGGYHCQCMRKWNGTNCDILKNICNPNPCQNGGTCMNNMCICPTSFTGSLCQQQNLGCGRLIGTSGTLKYKPMNGTSAGNINCPWVITTARDKVLNISFKSFNIPDCRGNFMQLHDGENTASLLLGRFCGDTIKYMQVPLITTTHMLYIWFRIVVPSTRSSFELTWNSVDPVCGGNINAGEHGKFESPGSPGQYPPNRDCYWRFTAPIGKRIEFHFFSLMIGFNKDCDNDYLAFHQGQEPTDPLITKFCNTTHPEPLVSPGHEVLVHFHSDNNGSFPGFQISYFAIAGTPGCGGLYTADEGEITSPVSRGKYPSNTICEYNIYKLPGTSRIKLTFLSFAIETSNNCEFDYLAIYDGTSLDAPLIGKYCGTTIPAPIISAGTELLIRFKSDWSKENNGFKMRYETICGGKYISQNGTITSPKYAVDKPKVCIYEIVQPEGSVIALNLTEMLGTRREIKDCELGYIEMRDGYDENAKLLGKYCYKGDVVYSTYNYVWIKILITPKNDIGFQIKYNTINNNGCGGIYRTKLGTIESPEPTDDEVKCEWLLIAPVDHIVRLFWVKLNINEEFDEIRVIDNGTNPSSEMGLFKGNKLPPTLISFSNIVTVKASMHSIETHQGFLLSYAFVHEKTVCGGKYFTNSGVLRSPHYPNSYPINMDCEWVITVEPGQQIMLISRNFSIEDFFSCKYDSLEIRNGGTSASPLIGKYCGDTIPKRIPSHANQLYLRFFSDLTRRGRGFEFEWTSVTTGCGGTLSSAIGTIISPHYPEPYSRNSECIWKIVVGAGSLIQVVFADLDLETHYNCVLDYVQLFDGLGTQMKSLGKYCVMNIGIPQIIKTTKNQLTVKFRSDISNEGRGFQLQYTTLCNNTLTGFNGVIESIDNQKGCCVWRIEVTKGNNITLSFSHFYFENRPFFDVPRNNCSQDYLQIQYVRDTFDEEDTKTQGIYCGEQIPDDIHIQSNVAIITHFVPDHFFLVYNSSFRLEWQLEGCGGVLTHPTGAISSPNYPHPYPNSVHCEWLIQTDFGKSIEIEFRDIDVEKILHDCIQDYIQIHNGLDGTYPEITKICSIQNKPIKVISTGNYMYIKFVVDDSYTGRGFTANYTTHPTKCGGSLTAPQGVVHSPNYPNNFDNNDTCWWLIDIEENHVINLDVKDLDFIRDCNLYYVKIHDGPTAAYPLLATLCGDEKPNGTITSSTNHVYIEMITHPYISTKGFLIEYKTACGARIKTQSSGIITYNQNSMVQDENCSWTIISERPDEHVHLTLTYLDAACMFYVYGGMYIYDGENRDAPLIGNYCNNTIPPLITSTGSALHISVPRASTYFAAHYTVVDTKCGGTLNSLNGVFASPNYPDNYPVDIQCEWSLNVAVGNKIQIIFSVFELAESPNCNEDYLEIRKNGSGGHLLGVYCGKNMPMNISVNENIWLYFKSDKPMKGVEATTAKGFQATYSISTVNEIFGTSGQIASPLYPSMDIGVNVYTWRITVKLGFEISIKFLDFDVEFVHDENSCYLSQVQVFNGYDENSPSLLDKECGSVLPSPVRTTSNVVFIQLFNSISRKGSKFLLEWNEVSNIPIRKPINKSIYAGCGSDEPIVIPEGATYNLSSPTNAAFRLRMTCEWIFTTTSDKHLMIDFDVVDISKSVMCLGEFVKVLSGRDGTSTYDLVARICNANSTDGRPIETTNLMKIVYKRFTLAYVNNTGFNATIREVCGGTYDAPTGIIKVDNLTRFRNEEPPYECQWNITVRSGRTIQIVFQSFNLGTTTTKMCENFLLIRNGQYADSPLLGIGKFCGNVVPDTLNSTGNYLYLKYTSKSAFVNFKLSYREVSIDCNQDIALDDNNNSTIISSPNYPNIPPPFTECVWRITVPAGESIRLDFIERFDLTEDKSCSKEYIEIRNGGTKRSPLIGKYCNDMPNTQRALDDMMYVRFYTDVEIPKNGFKAKVSIDTCGGTLRGKYGDIRSPGFNNERTYPLTADCKWAIVGPKDHFLHLDFEVFDLPYAFGDCNNKTDRVILTEYNKVNKQEITLGTYCGKMKNPISIKSSSNEVNVYFKRNGIFTASKGFKLIFNASQEACGGKLNADSGVITSPGYPVTEHYNRTCEWVITVEKGRRISIELNDVDIDKTDILNYGLAFFEGHDFLSLITYLKNSATPKEIKSSYNVMTILFWSWHTTSHRGIKLTYTSNEPSICTGSLNEPLGVISVTANVSNYNCKWYRKIDQPDFTETVAFSVSATVNSQSQLSCAHIYSQVTLTFGESKYNAAEFCKTIKHPVTFRLPYSDIELSLLRGKDMPGVEIKVNYKAYKCGGLMNDVLGYFTSPGFPNSQNTSYECAWLIKVEEYEKIALKFPKINLGDDCGDSFIKVYNGDSANSPEITKICGYAIPPTIISQRNTLWVEYHSPGNNNGIGFNATYEPVAFGCGGILHHTKSVIETPNYPKDYPNGAECLWELRVQAGYHIVLTFADRFQIEESTGCTNDFVAVYDKKDTALSSDLKYCGRNASQSKITSKDNKLFVLFRSNNQTTGAGFRARYEVACGGEFAADNIPKYIFSPGYPKNYGNNLNCVYKIYAPNKYIVLNFEDFDLEKGRPSCFYDKLTIVKRGMITRHNNYYVYCGTNKPKHIRIRGNITVTFTSDAWLSKRGFKFSYNIDECGSEITKPGTITGHSPKITNMPLYEGPVNCTWFIKAPKDQRVSVRFNEINLMGSSRCISQAIYVRNSDGTLLSQMCGSIQTDLPVIHSNRNNMTLSFFYTSYTTQESSFTADVYFTYGPSMGCGGDIDLTNTTTKTIETPTYGNLDCVWVVTTSSNYVIKIEVLEEHYAQCYFGKNATHLNNCSCVAYEFRDGFTSGSELIDVLCDNELNSTVSFTTSRQYAWLRIISGTALKKPTKIKFTAVFSECGPINLYADETPKYLTTPNFPSNYPPNQKCTWRITTSMWSQKISIRFIEFDINNDLKVNESLGCEKFDRLEIVDRSNKQFHVNHDIVSVNKPSMYQLNTFNMMLGSHSFCSSDDKNYEYISQSGSIQVTFNSKSYHKMGKGIKMEYSVLDCNRNYTSLNGRITNTWQTGNCSIYIIVPEGYTISLYFTTFHVPNNCQTNLEVYEQDKTKKKLLEFCLQVLPPPVFSSGNQLYIKLNKTRKYGISLIDAVYTSTKQGIGCGGELYNFKGALTSPNYPLPFTKRKSCTWNIKVPLGLDVGLKFTAFNLDGSCDETYVVVTTFVGNAGNEHKFCKGDNPSYLLSSGKFIVKHVNKGYAISTGWSIRYVAITTNIELDNFVDQQKRENFMAVS